MGWRGVQAVERRRRLEGWSVPSGAGGAGGRGASQRGRSSCSPLRLVVQRSASGCPGRGAAAFGCSTWNMALLGSQAFEVAASNGVSGRSSHSFVVQRWGVGLPRSRWPQRAEFRETRRSWWPGIRGGGFHGVPGRSRSCLPGWSASSSRGGASACPGPGGRGVRSSVEQGAPGWLGIRGGGFHGVPGRSRSCLPGWSASSSSGWGVGLPRSRWPRRAECRETRRSWWPGIRGGGFHGVPGRSRTCLRGWSASSSRGGASACPGPGGRGVRSSVKQGAPGAQAFEVAASTAFLVGVAVVFQAGPHRRPGVGRRLAPVPVAAACGVPRGTRRSWCPGTFEVAAWTTPGRSRTVV